MKKIKPDFELIYFFHCCCILYSRISDSRGSGQNYAGNWKEPEELLENTQLSGEGSRRTDQWILNVKFEHFEQLILKRIPGLCPLVELLSLTKFSSALHARPSLIP